MVSTQSKITRQVKKQKKLEKKLKERKPNNRKRPMGDSDDGIIRLRAA